MIQINFRYVIFIFIILLCAAAGTAQDLRGSCWRIPDLCYAIEIGDDHTKLVLAGIEHGARSAHISTIKNNAGNAELLCFERIVHHGIECSHYYICKPVSNNPLHIDTETVEYLEVRWTVPAAKPLEYADIRHRIKVLDNWKKSDIWHRLRVRSLHWHTVSSGSPQCTTPITEDP